MATRMANAPYKKILIRIPEDILEVLQQESSQEDRSVNGELVHALREWVAQKRQERARRQAVGHA